MVSKSGNGARRRQLMDALSAAGRESSTAAVLFHTALAEKAGLAASDTKTLDVLLRRGPLTAGELAVHTGLATASVTSLIDRLEKKGLARRAADPQDRRRVVVEPILEEIKRLSSLYGSIARSFKRLYDSYTDEQLETILDFMRRSAARTREMIAAMAEASGSAPVPKRRSRQRHGVRVS